MHKKTTTYSNSVLAGQTLQRDSLWASVNQELSELVSRTWINISREALAATSRISAHCRESPHCTSCQNNTPE